MGWMCFCAGLQCGTLPNAEEDRYVWKRTDQQSLSAAK
jgi:hypothetical protein